MAGLCSLYLLLPAFPSVALRKTSSSPDNDPLSSLRDSVTITGGVSFFCLYSYI